MPGDMSPEIPQSASEGAAPKGTIPEKPVSEWGIRAVEKRLTELREIEGQVRGSKRKRDITEEEASVLSVETRALVDRKNKLYASGTRQAIKLKSLIQAGRYRDSDYRRSERRVEAACERLFPDNPELQEEVEEANLVLIRDAYVELEERIIEAKAAKEPITREMQRLILSIETMTQAGGTGGNLENALQILGETLRTESTYDIFIGAELYQAPIALQVDTFPPGWFKKPPEWFEGETEDWQDLIRARIRMANAAFIKRKVANINPEAAKDNEQLSLTWREFMLIYNMPGVRMAFENVFEE
ncbi:MAG TPA: hypothetical protein VMX76_01560, partial [Nevskiaceae bacterium]|nr:hypothetical protein [Nevskiaceae bacterium]